jgi:5-formyltetrahydrofolate cyclo-ligase
VARLELSLPVAKSAIRREMRFRRANLVAERDRASDLAAEQAPVDRWVSERSGETWFVAAYRAMAAELDPAPILRRLTALGAVACLPVVVGRGEPMVFREWTGLGELQPDAAGIPAPPPSAPERTPRLIIAPVVAFDRAGGRLGQGGGYYDRTVRHLRAQGGVTVIGLAYACQEVDRVPTGPRDEPLDAILTEKAYIAVREDFSCA